MTNACLAVLQQSKHNKIRWKRCSSRFHIKFVKKKNKQRRKLERKRALNDKTYAYSECLFEWRENSAENFNDRRSETQQWNYSIIKYICCLFYTPILSFIFLCIIYNNQPCLTQPKPNRNSKIILHTRKPPNIILFIAQLYVTMGIRRKNFSSPSSQHASRLSLSVPVYYRC